MVNFASFLVQWFQQGIVPARVVFGAGLCTNRYFPVAIAIPVWHSRTRPLVYIVPGLFEKGVAEIKSARDD
jgi:hypothetical protein